MPTIWVDTENGDNSNGGTGPGDAYKTINFASGTASSGDVLYLLDGVYTNDTFANPDISFTLSAKGYVIIRSTLLGIFVNAGTVIPLTATRQYTINNIIFEDWSYVIVDNNLANDAFTVDLFFDNCIVHRNSIAASAVLSVSANPGPALINPKLHFQNCTVRNTDSVYYINSNAVASSVSIDIEWERNNIYEVTTAVGIIDGLAGPGNLINRLDCDYNAVPTGDIIGANDFSISVTPPVYISTGSPFPIDLSLKRDSNTAYIGTGGTGSGYLGNEIGARWHAVSPAANAADFYIRSNESTTGSFFQSNWGTSGWINDARWYDLGLPGAGTDAIAAGETLDAAPAILTVLDEKFIIDTVTVPGGLSARAISTVLDTLKPVLARGIGFFGEEPAIPQTLDTNKTGPTREIEYRSSNTSFTATSTSVVWNTIRRNSVPDSTPYQYWQFRVTIRNNATS